MLLPGCTVVWSGQRSRLECRYRGWQSMLGRGLGLVIIMGVSYDSLLGSI